jgi:hypothetical protein
VKSILVYLFKRVGVLLSASHVGEPQQKAVAAYTLEYTFSKPLEDKARQGLRQGKARQGKAGHGTARHGTARQGKARQGKARQGKARQCNAYGKARQGKGKARQGKARYLPLW